MFSISSVLTVEVQHRIIRPGEVPVVLRIWDGWDGPWQHYTTYTTYRDGISINSAAIEQGRQGEGHQEIGGGAPPTSSGHQSEEEVANIVDQLQTQQQQSARIHGQIANLLDVDQSSAMSTWGTFLGKMCARIDERLLPQYYRESLDHVLGFVDRSRMMPIAQPPPPPPLQQYTHFAQPAQQQLQQQQQEQQQPTFTSLLPPAPGTSQQQQSGYIGRQFGDGNPQASSSGWDTMVPTAGQTRVQTGVPARPLSTPNMSLTSMPRLSDISNLLTPGNPQDNPVSPSANQSGTGGRFFPWTFAYLVLVILLCLYIVWYIFVIFVFVLLECY